MPKTTVACPRCRTPITADINRLFDLTSDPQPKKNSYQGLPILSIALSAIIRAFILPQLCTTTRTRNCC
jgi:hypothetical protein